jgi:Cu(I)-responsive transcriptional regulator
MEHAKAAELGLVDIGVAARESAVSAKMIRHYESIGLLPKAARTAANYRVYRPSDVHTLRFIKRARTLGFSIEDIRQLLGLWQNRSRSSAAVKSISRKHLQALKQRIAEMQSMVDTLEHLARHCHGDHRPECPILADLAAPAA